MLRAKSSRLPWLAPVRERIVVSVEQPVVAYECPATKDVVATRLPSGERRVRLGMPARGHRASSAPATSNRVALNDGAMPRSERRHTYAAVVASTRSQAVSVTDRAPAGRSIGTLATWPYPW